MKKSKQSKKKGQNFAWSFVIVCFLLAGAVLLNMVSSRSVNFKKTSSSNLLVNKLCSNNSSDSGKVYNCGDYYVSTPSPLTSDMPSSVINKNGEVIAKCGGLMQFINDEERLKNSELCSQYTYTNCKVLNCQDINEQKVVKEEYNKFSSQYKLKYKTYEEAAKAFQENVSSDKILPDRISLYVPGKVPREDGSPYFIGSGTISSKDNKCIKGYFNLVTGNGKAWEDVCVIFN